MSAPSIEQLLSDIREQIQTLDSTVNVSHARSQELKCMVTEYNELKRKEKETRRERAKLMLALKFFVERYQRLSGGEFPDGMFPLFQKQDAA